MNNTLSNDPKAEIPANERAIDALLEEQSRHPKPVDEGFLKSLDAALDAVELSPEPAERPKTRGRWILSGVTASAIAACFAVFFGVIVIREGDQVRPPEIIATAAPATDHESVMKKQVVQQRPEAPSPPQESVRTMTAVSSSPVDVPTANYSESSSSVGLGVTNGKAEVFRGSDSLGGAVAPKVKPTGRTRSEGLETAVGGAVVSEEKLIPGAFQDFESDASQLSEVVASDASKDDFIAPEPTPAPVSAPKPSAVKGKANADELGRRLDVVEGKLERQAGERQSVAKNQAVLSKLQPAREAYAPLIDNPFTNPLVDPLSTFAVDVDTASYTNIRRMITDGNQPPASSVRIEEMINYFSYDYPQPEGEHPFSVTLETNDAPWAEGHRLVRVGLKGLEMDQEERPAVNLVFLLDVSGSMSSPDKLGLVKSSMTTLTEGLTGDDRVSIVTYAGSEGVALEPTDGSKKKKIIKALNEMKSGGSTNGEGGIRLAYQLAREQFIDGGANRIVLCTDGDFNVGLSGTDALVNLVKKEANNKAGGVYLSVCGFGSGNLNDRMLEAITNDGNGNYFYVDSAEEGEKVFSEDLSGTLVTIAKDVKIQVEFNPTQVQAYRLIGYANRQLRDQDFRNDKIDAGEIGAGHTVTALYEIVPTGIDFEPAGQPLKYQKPAEGVVDPSDVYLEAYLLMQDATKATEEENTETARILASRASQLLDMVSSTHSEWNPQMLDYRRKALNDLLESLGGPVDLEANPESKVLADRELTDSPELLTVMLRYKQPDATKADPATELAVPAIDEGAHLDAASADFKFAAAVAAFGMQLRESEHQGATTSVLIKKLAKQGRGEDEHDRRQEFIDLVNRVPEK